MVDYDSSEMVFEVWSGDGVWIGSAHSYLAATLLLDIYERREV